MDLGIYDARTAANEAKPMHLRHPVTGVYLYEVDAETGEANEDKPLRVLLQGTESRVVQSNLAKIRRARAKAEEAEKKGKAQEDQQRGLEQLHEALARDMVPLVRGFENIDRNGVPLDADNAENVEWFLNLQLINVTRDEQGEDLSFLGQVSSFVTDRSNWLGNSSNG